MKVKVNIREFIEENADQPDTLLAHASVDVDNLFVIDGSVHVTNGGFNPVLTIMAVAYYASANLVNDWRGTRFRS